MTSRYLGFAALVIFPSKYIVEDLETNYSNPASALRLCELDRKLCGLRIEMPLGNVHNGEEYNEMKLLVGNSFRHCSATWFLF